MNDCTKINLKKLFAINIDQSHATKIRGCCVDCNMCAVFNKVVKIIAKLSIKNFVFKCLFKSIFFVIVDTKTEIENYCDFNDDCFFC